MKSSLFSAILFCIGWMSVVVTGQDRPRDCCLTVSNTRIRYENITKYDIQEPPICTLRAVRFLTKKNKIICSDPDSEWAKKVMKMVDGRTTTQSIKQTTCFTSTTTTIPTTTNKRQTPETETSPSTTEPPKVTRIETPRLKTETSTTTTQQTSVSKETPESPSSTAITCGTRGPASSPTETTPGQNTDQTTSSRTTNTETTSTATTTATPKRTKLSPLLIKKRRKSKKRLHKYQNKSG